MIDVLLTANSPGEVAWIKALAHALEQAGKRCDVVLYPCTFATGQEARVLRELPAVNRVWEPDQLGKLIWSGGAIYPRGTPLIHIGGDLMYSVILRLRWGWRCWSYLWARPHWNRFLEGYFSRDERNTRGLLRAGASAHKVIEVGDLVVDGVDCAVGALPEKDPHLITFLPGSRSEELRHLLPFYARIAERLQAARPELRFQANLSPFLSWETLERELARPADPRLEGAPGVLTESSYLTHAGTEIQIYREQGLEQLGRSVLAVSIPGTKTAEAATLGVPCVTVVPLNCPEFLPTGGVLGWLDWLPGGSRLKGKLLLRQRHRVGLLAQPNQLFKRAVMPELVDELDAETVARVVRELLGDEQELSKTGLQLHTAYRQFSGCARLMLKAVGVDLL